MAYLSYISYQAKTTNSIKSEDSQNVSVIQNDNGDDEEDDDIRAAETHRPSYPAHNSLDHDDNNSTDNWTRPQEHKQQQLQQSQPYDFPPTSPSQTISEPDETLSEIPLLRRTHTTLGYRDGLPAGKSTIMQSSFDSTFPLGGVIGWRVGRILGVFEGYLACPSLAVVPGLKALVMKEYERAKKELGVGTLLAKIGESIQGEKENENEDDDDDKNDNETAAERAILALDFSALALTSAAQGEEEDERDHDHTTTTTAAATDNDNDDAKTAETTSSRPPPAPSEFLESLLPLYPQLSPILATLHYWEGTALGIMQTRSITLSIHAKEQNGEAWRDLVKEKRRKDGYMPGDSSVTGFGETRASGSQEGYGEREGEGKVAGKPEVGTVGTWDAGGCMDKSRAYWSRGAHAMDD